MLPYLSLRHTFQFFQPGYSRLRIDQFGKVQPDTRNPVLAMATEALGETENRYSGIPTMRRELKQAGMAEPEFRNEYGTFVVCFRKAASQTKAETDSIHGSNTSEERLFQFCAVPRTRQEIASFLGIKSVPYAIKFYVTPLVERGLIMLSVREKPKSPKRRYTAKLTR